MNDLRRVRVDREYGQVDRRPTDGLEGNLGPPEEFRRIRDRLRGCPEYPDRLERREGLDRDLGDRRADRCRSHHGGPERLNQGDWRLALSQFRPFSAAPNSPTAPDSPGSRKTAQPIDDIRDEAYRKTIETSIEARLRALSNTPVDDGIVKRTSIQWLLKKLGLPLEEDGSSETARAASALVQPNKEELLPLLIGMHAKLCNLRRKEDALVLGEVIDMITPLQIPPDLWRKIREQMTASVTVIRGGAAGIVTAETVAARIDGLEEPGPVKLSRKTDGDLTSPHRMLPKTYHPGRRFLSNQGSARAVREGTLHARAP